MSSKLPTVVSLGPSHATTSKDFGSDGRRRHKLTSPVLQAEEVVEVVAHKRRDLLQVVGSNPGGQQRLVGVSEGGVHQQQARVGAHGLGKALRAVTQEHVAESHRRLAWGRSYSEERHLATPVKRAPRFSNLGSWFTETMFIKKN